MTTDEIAVAKSIKLCLVNALALANFLFIFHCASFFFLSSWYLSVEMSPFHDPFVTQTETHTVKLMLCNYFLIIFLFAQDFFLLILFILCCHALKSLIALSPTLHRIKDKMKMQKCIAFFMMRFSFAAAAKKEEDVRRTK